MGKIRFFIAMWGAKCARVLLRLLGRNATNFPGQVAIKLCPDFLKYISKPKKIIAVTGTNGKTTVCNMTCDILESSGKRVLNNRLGSNINSGIATSLILGSTVFNRPKYDTAVFEIDERSSLRVYAHVKPDILLITNLFRDSIMRNAHPGYIADFLTSSIPPETKLILNADDLISSGVAPQNERVHFGIDRMEGDIDKCINLINDMRICPVCAGELEYDYLRYHHIGKARCVDCGFKAPEYDYRAHGVNLSDMSMVFAEKGEEHSYKLLSDSVFNIYNMVAVIALLREIGMPHAEILNHMEKTGIVESRYHAEEVGEVRVVMQMAKEKNALAGSRAFDYVSGQPGKKELLLMMNCLGDAKHWSENTCWLYDCDFEFLNNDDITKIVVTGPRAKDYYLRLLLAGVPEDKLVCTMDEFTAAELLSYTPGHSIYIFYGTDSLNLAFKVREKVAKIAGEKVRHEN